MDIWIFWDIWGQVGRDVEDKGGCLRHFENIAYSVIFGDTVYCLKKEQLARIPKLGFQSVTDSVLESIWMDCNYFLDPPLRSATAASMGQYIDKSNRRVRWALILANR